MLGSVNVHEAPALSDHGMATGGIVWSLNDHGMATGGIVCSSMKSMNCDTSA